MWTTENRVTLLDNYGFNEFYRRMILKLSKAIKNGEDTDPHDFICRKGFDQSKYSGKQNCRHNIAYAFIATKEYLTEHVSADPSSWTWGNAHKNIYPHVPFSEVPVLK